MWKIVARGIRETLERRVCRTNVYSQSSQDNAKNEVRTSLTCHQKFLAPVLVDFDKGFCGSAKSANANGKKDDEKWNTKHSWPEAFGWSSVLAAGWVVCQSLNKRVFDRDKDNNEKKYNKLIDYAGVSNILLQISNLQLRHILPVTNCVGDGDKKSNSKELSAGKQFGPITSEEAFQEAIDEFSNVHKVVVGEFELRYGIKALEEKRYKDAWMHFSRGAGMSSPGSMFNLGLCYELGIGTLADQKKAVKYYNGAAAHDHADALYNLGVFHAQGRGGLPIDIDTARACFTRAAKLGQTQAQHALDLERAAIRAAEANDILPVVPTGISLRNAHAETCAADNNNTARNGESVDYGELSASFDAKPDYNEGTTAKDATQVFLEFLGFREPSQTPILITNDYRVPC